MVSTAFNGEDGVTLAQKEQFDIILLDMMMPKMDGLAVLGVLKNRHDTTPVIMLSNLNQENYILKARELGVKDFLIKSNTPIAAIVERVTKILK